MGDKKKKRGRPKKKGDTLNSVITVRMTGEDRAMLRIRCIKAGMTLTEYCRSMLMLSDGNDNYDGYYDNFDDDLL